LPHWNQEASAVPLDLNAGKGVEKVGRTLKGFMHATERLQAVFGPATQGDVEAPVVHKHDDFESASEEELEHFEVEVDAEGHHYAVRKDDPGAQTTDYSV